MKQNDMPKLHSWLVAELELEHTYQSATHRWKFGKYFDVD